MASDSFKLKGASKALLAITLVWVLSRIMAWTHYDPQLSWDVWEARKLHEYGFLNRMGAMINYHFLSGLVSDPSQFNYVDHPAGAIWIYYLILPVLGNYGVIVFCALVGLAGCLLTHRVLLRFYDENIALWGAVLYTLAPISIFYDANPDLIALGVVFWPLGICIASQSGLSTNRKAWMLGATVFVAGQITWFAWMIYPCLILLTARSGEPFFLQLRKPFKNPIWVGLTIGLALTMAGFFAQIIGYSHDLNSAVSYALSRIHPDELGPSRLSMARTILIKFFLLTSPALFLGAIAGTLVALKQRGRDRLAMAALAGLGCSIIAVNVLIGFYYTELNGHRFILFPATLLTAGFLYRVHLRWVKPLVAVLSILGVVYAQFRVLAPGSSLASATIAGEFNRRFDPYALIISNLREHQPPFPSWEPLPSWNVSLGADRHVYLNSKSLREVVHFLARFRSQPDQPTAFFLVDPAQPIDEGLSKYLTEQAVKLHDIAIEFSPESSNLALELRSLYWRLSKSRYAHAAGLGNREAHSLTLQVYQLPQNWPDKAE